MRNSVVLSLAAFAACMLTNCTSNTQAEQIAQAAAGGARSAVYQRRHVMVVARVTSSRVFQELRAWRDRRFRVSATGSILLALLQNTPPNMVRWIENPPGADEHTVMPNLGVSHQDAIDIASYLYTLK